MDKFLQDAVLAESDTFGSWNLGPIFEDQLGVRIYFENGNGVWRDRNGLDEWA